MGEIEEIKVGEYVRTKNQGIFIISHINIDFDDSDFRKVCICQNKKVAFTNIDTIKELKHSPIIIDLIEVGDYVNGELVTGFGYEDVNGAKEKSILVEGKYTKVSFALLEWDIKSIVTKEQFSNIEYRLED